MYGLPRSGKLANYRLKRHLAKYGYKHTRLTQGLWRRTSRPVAFSLVVDDFGFKYADERDAQHLLDVIEDLYRVSA